MTRPARVQRNIDAVEYLHMLEAHGRADLPLFRESHPMELAAWHAFKAQLSPGAWAMIKLEIQTEFVGRLAAVFEKDVHSSPTDEVRVLVCRHCGREIG